MHSVNFHDGTINIRLESYSPRLDLESVLGVIIELVKQLWFFSISFFEAFVQQCAEKKLYKRLINFTVGKCDVESELRSLSSYDYAMVARFAGIRVRNSESFLENLVHFLKLEDDETIGRLEIEEYGNLELAKAAIKDWRQTFSKASKKNVRFNRKVNVLYF